MSSEEKNINNEEEPTILSLIDDAGNTVNLEVIDELEYKGKNYVLFLPCDIPEDSEDYGFVILQMIEGEDHMPEYADVEDQDELVEVYEKFSLLLYGDEDEEEEEK